MKHSKIDSRNFKKKKWKNTDMDDADKTKKYSLTIKDMGNR